MLKVLIFIATSCTAYNTYKHDTFASYGNIHAYVPVLDDIFALGNSNGRRPMQIYEYLNGNDGVVNLVNSVENQNPVLYNEGHVHQRLHTSYHHQYPYHRSDGQETWNTGFGVEPAQPSSAFINTNLDGKHEHFHHSGDRNFRHGNQEGSIKQTNPTNEFNKSPENRDVTSIATQLDVVNRTSIISKQLILDNDPSKQKPSFTEDNVNLTTSIRSIALNNKTNPIRFDVNKAITNNNHTLDKAYRPAQNNNNKIVNNTQNNMLQINMNNSRSSDTESDVSNARNAHNNTKCGAKTTEDNEVTPQTERNNIDEDRWIWSNGEEKIVETTTLLDLDDRAAFQGNGCPDGKIKVGNVCIEPD